MLVCLLLGLGVLGGIFLVPQGAKFFCTPAWQKRYKYSIFVLYTGSVLWLTLGNRVGREITKIRFQPFYVFRQMLNCWFGFKKISVSTCRAVFGNSTHLFDSWHASPVEDLLLNIILFVPFGFLLPYLWPRFNFYRTLLIGFVVSCSIELTQYLAQWGCVDIDDVFNDTLGVCLGYACWAIYKRVAR